MPTKPDKIDIRNAAADAAIAEVDGKKSTVTVEFNGKEYSFMRKRIEAVQLRRLYQKGRDLQAIEWLLSEKQFEAFLDASADDDGCTSEAVYREFTKVISQAVGAGNS